MKNQFSLQSCSALLLTALFFLSACQKNDQAPSGSSPGGLTAPGAPSPNDTSGSGPVLEGTADVGGGNGLDGRVLESYRVDVTKLEAFQKVIQPKLKTIQENDKKEDPNTKHGDNHTFNFKTWYLAPINLKTLNNKAIGLSSSEDRTEQLAIQTQKEIWIDKRMYDKMDIQHQAALIMHEYFMALYTLRFENGREICRFFAFESGCGWIDEESDFMKPVEESRPLNEDDYANIRSVTAWLMGQDATQLTGKLVNAKLRNANFDPRFVGREGSGDANDHFKKELDRKLSYEEVYTRLQHLLESEALQSKCTTNMKSLNSEINCVLNFDFRKTVLNERSEIIPNLISWNMEGEISSQGLVAINAGETHSSTSMSTDYSLVEMIKLDNSNRLFEQGLIKPGQKFFTASLIIKKQTRYGFLGIQVIGVLLEQKVYHGELKKTLPGTTQPHSCHAYSDVLSEDGRRNYVLFRAKGSKSEDLQIVRLFNMTMNSCEYIFGLGASRP